MKNASILCFAVISGTAAAARAQMYVDTFELGVNMGNWTLGCQTEVIEYWHGYNGAYLRGATKGVPEIRTRGSSVFTGDWTSRNATIFCFAMGVYQRPEPAGPLTLMISTDNGTPQDPADDWAAYTTPQSQVPPEPGAPWAYISYLVPHLDQAAVPHGWELLNIGRTPPAVRDWRVLLRNVSEVKVLFTPPGVPTRRGVWSFGVDDMRVEPTTTDAPCYPNCDGSTNPPILNPNDFQCYLHMYAAGLTYANCDGSTVQPILNANDFQCFMIKFAAGCT